MKKFLILILFLSSCSSDKLIKKNYNFNDKMSFEEFKIKLEDYSKNKQYPNIDN